jgi:hypothetical protein
MIRIVLGGLLLVICVVFSIYRHINPGGNLIYPITDRSHWAWQQQSRDVSGGVYLDQGGVRVDVTKVDADAWHLNLCQETDKLQPGRMYRASFDAKADHPRKMIIYCTQYGGANMGLFEEPELTPTWKHYVYEFKALKAIGRYQMPAFYLGQETGSIWIKDVKVELAG